MQNAGHQLRLSAGDLVGHLQCRHLTHLDLAVANDQLKKPAAWDPLLEILRERGARHEKGFVDHLQAEGYAVTAIEGVGIDADAVARTLEAMRAGAEIIFQGAFEHGQWCGRPDILRRIDAPSSLGAWSYEVIDTKLARETKGGTLLQLCLYSELVGLAQGLMPEYTYVVAPLTGYVPQEFRTADFGAYYRRVKAGLETALTEDQPGQTYPDPVEHCDICRWRESCDARRRADDHLCLVAGISKGQIGELQGREIGTAAALAAVPLPLPWKPSRGAAQSFERAREQARIQVQARETGQLRHEALPVQPGFGLSLLPEPSPGDIFFDLEGDPYVGEHGLEYLFGYSFSGPDGKDRHVAEWAFTRAQEKAAFERFVDFVIDRLGEYPGLHVYHYASYEPGALKRLMGRYATREDEIDRMLRSGLFVDLYGVVRHAVRASVESYSIKKLEPFYGFARETPLADANYALTKVQGCLELGDLDGINNKDRAVVQAYNREDCVSTRLLRDWLEGIRAELVADGTVIDRPAPKDGGPGEALSDWQQRIAPVIEQLSADVPPDIDQRTDEQQARWLLANLIDWHRREQKALWWEYFRLRDLSDEDLLDERAALSGLSFVGGVGGTAKAPVDRYAFPGQETELRGGEDLNQRGGGKFGKVESVSLDDLTVDIKKRGDTADTHPQAVFAHKVVRTEVLAEALLRLGQYVANHGISGEGDYQAARDLLLRLPPRLQGAPTRLEGETTLDAALRIAPLLDGGMLPIQGPPGAGKTFTGARMICALVEQGKRVDITGPSHKVINNLLEEVLEAADQGGSSVRCIQKVSEKQPQSGAIVFETNNETALHAISPGGPVLGGTPWLWAREDARDALDVLFVDEAAQVSLANVIAVSQAARSVVLLGDPRQLEQPIQGAHPDGTDVSALDHILGEHKTVPGDRGLFLDQTWRLHPSICAFTSELFYEGRLRSKDGLEAQEVRSHSRVAGNGLLDRL